MQRINKNSAALKNLILPLITMLLWGSLFPFIKIGYKVCKINTDSIADILMFASLRFVICGITVCLIALFSKTKISKPSASDTLAVCVMGIFAVSLHYGFTYVGLSMTDSSKTAILKQIAPLLFACFSFLFVKEEKFALNKILGALIGFGGIISINAGTSFKGFATGDILIISASVCTVISMIISGRIAKGISPFWITGISQLFGGGVLFITAVIMGGKIYPVTIKAILVFAYICTASIVGYTLFYYVQRTAELSKLFIIKFAEPLFACIFSAVMLGENILKAQYLIAFVLISAGIVIANAKNIKTKS